MANGAASARWAPRQLALWSFSGLIVVSLAGAVVSELPLLAAIPVGVLAGYHFLRSFSLPFWLLLFSIPFSTEVSLPGGLGTDLPSEPLMWVIFGLSIVFLARHGASLSAAPLRHRITLLLIIHLAWIAFSSLHSQAEIVSLKYLLAKLWYVVAFFGLGVWCLNEKAAFKRFFWLIFSGLSLTVVVVLIRQAMMGFAFDGINTVMGPFYRNKVMYACLIVMFLPFVWYARRWYAPGTRWRWVLNAGVVLFLTGIYFSYTRAAMGGVLIAIVSTFMIRWKMTRYVILAALLTTGVLLTWLSTQYTYLKFAPNYERTVYHEKFDNLLAATYKLEDISTMERAYRWVAGAYMVADRPLLGFGPGTFYFFYRSYTVLSFQTYVSDNPEKSGVHNAYLMIATEQGLPGLLVYLALIVVVLLVGENTWHRLGPGWRRDMVMAALLSLIIMHALQIMNDLVETVKAGSLFFLCTAIIVNMSLYVSSKNQKESETLPPEEPAP